MPHRMQTKSALIIFARLPEPGKVKTRLARDLGNERACQFYKVCAESIIREASKCKSQPVGYLFFSEKEKEDDIRRWVQDLCQGNDLRLEPQAAGGDVGVRMLDAFERVFAEGANKAVVIGTDIPDLRAEHIDKALEALDSCEEVVFGPAEDGGYYLLGLRAPAPARLFQGIAWSTPKVLEWSLSIAASVGLQVAPLSTLPALRDIDNLDDLMTWQEESMPHHQILPTLLSQTVDELLENHRAEVQQKVTA